MEPEICTKMLKKLSEKLRAKFPATTPGCSIVKLACLDDTSLEVFLTESKPSRRSITSAKRKEKEKKERRKKIFKNRKAKRHRSPSGPKTKRRKRKGEKGKAKMQCMPEPECHKT